MVGDRGGASFWEKHNFHVCACFHLPESQYCELRKGLRWRLKEELLIEALNPQTFDVFEMPAVIGEEGEVVLPGGHADHKIEVGDALSSARNQPRSFPNSREVSSSIPITVTS